MENKWTVLDQHGNVVEAGIDDINAWDKGPGRDTYTLWTLPAVKTICIYI